jgi:hypothetical protein
MGEMMGMEKRALDTTRRYTSHVARVYNAYDEA